MISFAIIGTGNIGSRHARHIIENPNARLTAVCDINPDKALLAREWNVPYYQDPQSFFEQVRADVINICTPNYLHLPHAVAALAAGSHALVEKPMALSVKECEEMIAASQMYHKKIFAVKQNRYNPPIQIAKRLMNEQVLGKVYMVQVNCFWNRNEHYYQSGSWRGKRLQDGGCLFTQFSHFIDILYYLIGEVTATSGSISNFLHRHNTDIEDTGSFILRNKQGAIVNFNFTTNAYQKNMEGSITLMGSEGVLKIGGQYLNTIEYSQIKNTELPRMNIQAKENDYGTYQGSMSNHDKVIQNVIDVLEKNEKIMTSAEEGMKVISIIEDMYRAAQVLNIEETEEIKH
ncbi:MAG: Gfo/Idh/MocA family oxidoreductase [Taibaiella sp.]|nr:Gfo/Idh/MocA family oxidoreductase [Taibaiella sp.]MBX9449181.1 Gfo/Idh/MocA family oxidoreductase [Taibaiella sp.]